MKLAENSSRISEIECRLSKYTYLTRSNLPGYPDGVVFRFLTAANAHPDRVTHPHFYHWYILMRQFSAATIDKWISDRRDLDPLDSLPIKFVPNTPPTSSSDPSLSRPTENINLNNFDPKNTDTSEVGPWTIISVLLRGNSGVESSEAERLRRGLEGEWKKGMEVAVRGKEVKVRCWQPACDCDKIANFITNSVQFHNIQIKREKKPKTLRV